MTKVYKPINSKYIRTNGIYHNRTLLSDYLDSEHNTVKDIKSKINIGRIVVAKNNSDHEPIAWARTGTWDYISMTVLIENTNTTAFSSDSGQIKIGKGVKKVRAYGQAIVQIDGWNANKYLFSRISKNNVGVSKCILSELGWLTLYNEAYIDVSEGDIIRFQVYADNASTKRFYNYKGFGEGYGNFFVVEAIE